MNSTEQWNILLVGAAGALALLIVFFRFASISGDAPSSVAASALCTDIRPRVSLIADAAYVSDLESGSVLYEKNADAQLPLASLTKLATAFTAANILSSDDIVTIHEDALAPEGDVGLLAGEQWRVDDLIDYTLMTSANDGARALALAAAAKRGGTLSEFFEQMNEVAQELGMHETFFASDTGLDISSTTASAYGSAQNVATLVASIVSERPRLLEGASAPERTFVSASGFSHEAINTTGVGSALTGTIASKTGFTDLAGGNLVVVFEPIPGRPVAAVVLGSTREGRDADIEMLAAGVKTALKRMLVCDNGARSP